MGKKNNTETLRLVEVRQLATSGEARRLRVAAGLTEQEMAIPVGVERPTISRWERGKQRPTGPAALRYLDLLIALRKVVGDVA